MVSIQAKRSRKWMHAAMAVLSVCFLIAGAAHADNWHYGTHIRCTDCHTNHNSANGQPMRYDDVADPAHYLLRRGTAQTLCLSCHDGSSPSAPDVVATVSYVSESAAGPFANSGGTTSAIAHDLGSPVPQIPPGGTQPMVLTCTTCHDPHGNANYRNLRPDPSAAGIANVTVLAVQTTLPDGGNPADVYVPGNIVYKSGVSHWCRNCHGSHPGSGNYPDDRPIFGTALASYTRWAAVTLPRVPVHSPTDDDVPSTDDRVMCLSCHKAHGSQNPQTLIYADGATLDSTCEECHDP